MKGKTYSVYVHTTPGGKRYVGMTRQKPVDRWLNGKGYQKQTLFYDAILKYGWDNIKHEVVRTGLTADDAGNLEALLIEKYHTDNPECGYNIEKGGLKPGTRSESTIDKVRKANTGKHHSAETRHILSELEKKRWRDPDYRANQIEKRLGHEPWNKGKTTPEETREKQRNAKLGKYVGSKHWNSKQIINLDTGVIYESIGLAAKAVGAVNGSHIVSVCKGKRQKAYGCRWAYYKGGGANVSHDEKRR